MVRVAGAWMPAAENIGRLPGGLEAAVVVEVPLVGQRVAVRVEAGRADRDAAAFDDGVRTAGVDRRAGVEVHADDDRVVVGRAVRARIVERRDLAGRLELGVVVEHDRLVGVDVPIGGAGHLCGQRRARQPVVEVARLAVEHVRVGGAAAVRRDEVGEAGPGQAS